MSCYRNSKICRARNSRNEKGIGKFTVLFFGAVISGGFYLAYQILPFYYYYYELQTHFQQIARVGSAETTKSIRRKLGDHMKWMQIPADAEDIQINKSQTEIQLELEYTEYFDVPFLDETWEFPFYVYANEIF